MVDDLLDLAKVEAGRLSISPEWFDLLNLFTALHGMFKPLIDSDRVTLVFDAARGRAEALHRRSQAGADPSQLHLERAEVHEQWRRASGGELHRR